MGGALTVPPLPYLPRTSQETCLTSRADLVSQTEGRWLGHSHTDLGQGAKPLDCQRSTSSRAVDCPQARRRGHSPGRRQLAAQGLGAPGVGVGARASQAAINRKSPIKTALMIKESYRFYDK